ncbi:MAG: leucine-rich repeat domain-containing protein [Rhodobacteraceae bacterium]|nr:leucine-rich repeat domain-containing protein [Paracoccaceae bacterium]
MLSRFPAKLKIPALILGSFLLSFGIVACVETTGSDPEAARAEHEATRLREGEAILSDCIATQCSTLDLDGKRLADYGAINGLTHVKVLMLSYTDFDDLSDIAGMTQLTELHIGQTALTDLSGLSSFPNLRLLHAQSNYSVSDFTPIGRLTTLEELAVGNWQMTSAAFVGSLRRLKRLDVSVANLDTAQGIANHPSLEVLDIGEAAPPDLGFLTTIPHLKRLSIGEPYGNDAGAAVLDRLKARGVEVTRIEAVVVC